MDTVKPFICMTSNLHSVGTDGFSRSIVPCLGPIGAPKVTKGRDGVDKFVIKLTLGFHHDLS